MGRCKRKKKKVGRERKKDKNKAIPFYCPKITKKGADAEFEHGFEISIFIHCRVMAGAFDKNKRYREYVSV